MVNRSHGYGGSPSSACQSEKDLVPNREEYHERERGGPSIQTASCFSPMGVDMKLNLSKSLFLSCVTQPFTFCFTFIIASTSVKENHECRLRENETSRTESKQRRRRRRLHATNHDIPLNTGKKNTVLVLLLGRRNACPMTSFYCGLKPRNPFSRKIS